MNTNTDQSKIPYPVGTVLIASILPLEDVAKRISNLLSIHIREDTDGIYEEFPSYYGNALGLRFALMKPNTEEEEFDAETGKYLLKVYPQFRFTSPDFVEAEYQKVNISPLLQALLSELSDWEISPMNGRV